MRRDSVSNDWAPGQLDPRKECRGNNGSVPNAVQIEQWSHKIQKYGNKWRRYEDDLFTSRSPTTLAPPVLARAPPALAENGRRRKPRRALSETAADMHTCINTSNMYRYTHAQKLRRGFLRKSPRPWTYPLLWSSPATHGSLKSFSAIFQNPIKTQRGSACLFPSRGLKQRTLEVILSNTVSNNHMG